MFYDQYGDYDKDFAIKLANHIVLKPRDDLDELDDKDFAIIIIGKRPHRQFPIADKESTLLSLIYFLKNLDRIEPTCAEIAGARIKEACFRFDIEAPSQLDGFSLGTNKSHYVDLEKLANELAAKKIDDVSELDDSVFGLIIERAGEKIRKFPMPDEEHVRKAFEAAKSMGPARREYQERLLKNIERRASELGIELNITKESPLNPNLKRDMKYFARNMDKTAQAAYEKLAQLALDGKITADEACAALEMLNKQNGVASYKYRLSPEEIIYGTQEDVLAKSASARLFAELLDPSLTKTASIEDKITAALESEEFRTKLDEYFGEGFADDLKTDPKAIFNSLPTPHKDIIRNLL